MPATKHSRIIDLLRKAIALLIGCAIVLATLEKMGGVPAHGEESAVEDADSAIAFRRIFAPADRIDTWPRDSVRYLPIESDEFEKLVKDAQARSGSAAKLEPARITTAEYRATLEGDEFNGELTWTIANAGQSATFMELPTLGIAIESAQWAADSRPALLGADPRGKCGLWVDTTGSLRAKWSFKGETASGQESLAFRMSLPSAVQNRLILDIPSTSVLTVDRGWARSIPGAAPGWNRLQIDLGAEHQVVIHLAAESVIPEFAIPARYRQTESYEIAPHGMTLETRLRVASRRRPLERLTLKVDRGLSPVAVSANGQIISWSMRATASEGVSEMELQFAEPRLHDDLVIDILSLGVKPEVAQSLCDLPRIVPRGLQWLEGITTLRVVAPLTVLQLETDKCRLERRAELVSPEAGEMLDIQSIQEQAKISVALGPPPSRVFVQHGTSIELGANEMLERMVVDVQVNQGEEFSLHSVVGPQWTIDSVEIRDPGNSVDWTESPPADDGSRGLLMRFSKPLTKRKSVQLICVGRRASAVDQAFGMADLEMLRFANSAVGARLFYVKPSDSYEIQLTGNEELRRVSYDRLTPEQLKWFFEIPNGLLFSANSATRRLTVKLEPRRPGYSGEIEMDVAADDDSLAQTCTVRCTPEAARVERVLVHFVHAGAETWRWSLTEGASGEVVARRLSTEESAALGLASGVTWELTLSMPRAVPFELRAATTVAWTERHVVPLAMMPEATNQRGVVRLRVVGRSGVEIRHQGLPVVVPEETDDATLQTIRGVYRYDPRRDAVQAEQSLLSIAPIPLGGELPQAWVWEGHLDSRLATPEASVHVVSYQIESAGGSRIGVQMPAGATVRGIWRNGIALPQAYVESLEPRFDLDLPPATRFSTVALFYTTAGELPTHVGEATPHWPQLDIPILGRHWTLRLPDGYQLLGGADQLQESSQDPTWSERLFGPLGVSASPNGGSRWSLRRITEWLSFSPQVSREDALAKMFDQSAKEKLDLTASQTERVATWAQLFTAADTGVQTLNGRLLIDVAAFDRIGISANRAAADDNLAMSDVSPSAIFGRAGLALLVHDRALVVVTVSDVFSHSDQLAPIGSGYAFRVLDGSLARKIDSAVSARGFEPYWTVSRWADRPERALSIWNHPTNPFPQWRDCFGWSEHQLESPAKADCRVRIVRLAAIRSLGWGLFWIVLATGIWIGRQTVGRWVFVVSAGAAAALVVPAAMSPISTPLFLGVVASVAWHLTDWRQLRPMFRMPHLAGARFTRAGRALLLVGLVSATLTSQWQSRAEDRLDGNRPVLAPTVEADVAAVVADNPQKKSRARRIHKVFVPVDSQGQPLPERIHVPEALYRELLRRAGHVARPAPWITTDALYRLSATGEGVRSPAYWSKFVASFRVATFDRETIVSLPVGLAANDVLTAGRIQLDGDVTKGFIDGGRNAVLIHEPGVHEIEIRLDSRLSSLQTQGECQFAIPPIPAARLEWDRVSDGRIDTNALRSVGTEKYDASKQVSRVALGPSDVLSIAAPRIGRTDNDASLEVQELLWLKVRPNQVIVESRFRFHVLEGQVRRVRLFVDPADLHLLPPGEDPMIANVRPAPGSNQLVDIELSKPATDKFELQLSFELRNPVGVGRVPLPRLHAVDARSTARWVAVDSDTTLETREPTLDDDSALSQKEFAAAWSDDAKPPHYARRLAASGDDGFEIEIIPRESDVAVDQTHSIHFHHQEVSVATEWQATITGGALWSFNLIGPSAFEVDRVSVRSADVEQVARWWRDPLGRLHAFVKSPLSGAARVRVEGRLSRQVGDYLQFPLWQWAGAKRTRGIVRMSRDADVRAEMVSHQGLEPIESQELLPELSDGRRAMTTWMETTPQPTVEIAIDDNFPRGRAIQVDSLVREGDGWTLHVDAFVEVASGVMDQLRFEIPDEFVEPTTREASNVQRLVSPGADERRQLIVVPVFDDNASAHVRFSGGLRIPPGERLRVPNVRLMTAVAVDRYVVLPMEIESQPVAWELFGLIPSELPRSGTHGPPIQEGFRVFHSQGGEYKATVKSVERSPSSCAVRLADVHWVLQSNGDGFGVSLFDLSATSEEAIALQLPPGVQLMHARRSGHAISPQFASRGKWIVPVGPSPVSQRLELILSSERADAPLLSVSTLVPELSALSGRRLKQVESSLSTIHSPPSRGQLMLQNSAILVDESYHQFQRIGAIVDDLDISGDVVAGQLPEDLTRWRRQWRRRYDVLRAELQAEMRRLGNTDNEITRELRGMDQRLQKVAAATDKPESVVDARMTLQALVDGRHVLTRLRGSDDVEASTIRFQNSAGESTWPRVSWASVMLAFGVAVYRVAKKKNLPVLHPKKIAFGAVAVWVAFLDLPFIGLACLGALATGLWLQRRSAISPRRG